MELLDACIARIARFNPAVHAICATDFERARETARAAEAQVMRGAPLGPLRVKDLPDTAGLLNASGCAALSAITGQWHSALMRETGSHAFR